MPIEERPIATYALIFINVVVSLYAFANDRFFVDNMFIVGAVQDGQYHRMLTSGFLHGGMAHLLFNMFTLYFFGPVLEDRRMLGRGGFLIIYFASLIAGNLYALQVNADDPNYAAVGASGAISGVMVAVSLFAPLSSILLFGFIPMPAIVFTVLYIGFSAYAIGGDTMTLIGHEAHLGGAVAGLVLTIAMRPHVVPDMVAKISGVFNRRR